jgi:hypothetical protein
MGTELTPKDSKFCGVFGIDLDPVRVFRSGAGEYHRGNEVKRRGRISRICLSALQYGKEDFK